MACNGRAQGAGERQRTVRLPVRQHAHDQVNRFRTDDLIRQGACFAWRSHHGDQRNQALVARLFHGASNAHGHRSRKPDGAQLFQHVRARVQHVRQFGAAQAQCRCGDEDAGVGRIDHGQLAGADAGHVQYVHHAARGQQFARGRATGVQKVQPHRRARSRHAGNHQLAHRHALAACHAKRGPYQLARVGVVDADYRFALCGGHQPFVHREGPHGRGHVAAVAAVVDLGVLDLHLREGVVDVGVRSRRRADHTDLGERRHAAAHAVELPAVGVGAADGGQEDRVPCRALRWQVRRMEDQRLAGAATGEYGGVFHVGGMPCQ